MTRQELDFKPACAHVVAGGYGSCSEIVNGNVYHQSLDWPSMLVSTALYNAGHGRVLTLRHPGPNGNLHTSIGMKPHDSSSTVTVSIY
jgi:hypothetical protein